MGFRWNFGEIRQGSEIRHDGGEGFIKVVTICSSTCLRTGGTSGESVALIRVATFGRRCEKSAENRIPGFRGGVGGVSSRVDVKWTSGCLGRSRSAAEGISGAVGGIDATTGGESAKNRFSESRGGALHSFNADSKFQRRLPSRPSAEGISEPESSEANSPGAESAEM